MKTKLPLLSLLFVTICLALIVSCGGGSGDGGEREELEEQYRQCRKLCDKQPPRQQWQCRRRCDRMYRERKRESRARERITNNKTWRDDGPVWART
ncbi:hypothetical protein Acr_03g0018210 [Actinidia rufa]|uniref:Uncharacterized protein n=1 Tax=Actinidia rufa TaxID=165716 RepID=A0A7J0EHC9_9ERIC|nr:hypothetical protein Acr_03g0018210 [Actinidia rufa]